MFIPCYGWIDADDDHRRRVDRFFHTPMLVLALLVLPVLGWEWYTIKHPEFKHSALDYAVNAAMLFIWFAFAVEFMIKIAIAKSRVQYATKNWLDVVIIVMPMLRPFRALSVFRAARLAQMSRVFTLRGVLFKFARTLGALILGLEFVARLKRRFAKDTTEPTRADYAMWSKAALIAEIERVKSLANRRVTLDEMLAGMSDAEKQKLMERLGESLTSADAKADGSTNDS